MAKATTKRMITLEMNEEEAEALHDVIASAAQEVTYGKALGWLWDAVCDLFPDRSCQLGDYVIVEKKDEE